MFRYSHTPFVRLVSVLILGIVFSTFVFHNTWIFLILLISTLSVLTITSRNKTISLSQRMLSGSLTLLLVFLLGGFVSSHYRESDSIDHFATHYPEASILQAVIQEPLVEKKKSYKTVAKITSYLDSNHQWVDCHGKILIYLKKDSSILSLQYGDEIFFTNNIQPIHSSTNPKEFNYKKFLAFQYIHHQVYLRSGDFFIQEKHLFSFYGLAYRLRQMMSSVLINHGISGDRLAVASALLLGDKSQLDNDLQNAFASAGAMHVLAVSGLHVGIIYLILNGLLSVFGFKSFRAKINRVIIIILALWLYAMVTGLSPSVVRAATMFSAITIGNLQQSKQNIYNTLASSAFVLLVIKPNFLFEVGFQMSYLAVIGIVFFHPIIYHKLIIRNKMLDKIWSLTAVSIAAQLTTFPLALLYFHKFPTYFLLSNLIVIPAAALIMYLGILLFVVSPLDFISSFISQILIFVLDTLNNFVHWIEKFPYSVIFNIRTTILDTWVIYGIIFFSALYFLKQRFSHLIIGLTSILILALSQTIYLVTYQQYDYLCVYQINKQSAINFLSNDYNYIIQNEHMTIDLEADPFQMKNNWIAHGSGDSQLLHNHETNSPHITHLDHHLIGVAGRSVLLASSPLQNHYLQPIAIDYMIVTLHDSLDIDEWLENYQPKKIILDSSFSKYLAKKIKTKIPLGIPVHCTSIVGGIEIKLN